MKDKNSKRIILNFALSFCILIFAFCIFQTVSAAELKLSSQISETGINQQFKVDLLLNTENEAINVVEGKILYPAELVELKEIRDGNSIINFWIERPSLNSKSSILYSGIIPGGFNGRSGLVFSTIFEAKVEGDDKIELHDAKALLNDGKGTPADVKVSNFQFLISKQIYPMPVEMPKIEDNELPEDFRPEIAKDPNIFEGKYFLVFAAQDKKSGIDHYEIQENRKQKIENRKWKTAESPYVLKDQELRSYVYVRAIDKAGNERIATVEPQYPLRWYEIWWIRGMIIVVIIFAAALFWLWKKNKKPKPYIS